MCTRGHFNSSSTRWRLQAAGAIGWLIACAALAAITTTAIGGTTPVAFSQAWPCAPGASAVAAPRRVAVKRRAITKPAAVQAVGVGPQANVVRKPKRPRAKPVVAPTASRAPMPQDGCGPAPVAAPRALNALVGGAAPAPAYPQSALPPFTVPLDALPAVVDGAPDTGAPVPLHAMPAITDGHPGNGAPVSAPDMPFPFPWLPATVVGDSSSSTATSPDDDWSSPPQWPAVPPLVELPVENDSELQQQDQQVPPELPVVGPNLEPTDPLAPGVTTPGEVPEPASLALMLSGLLAAWAQALRKRRQARSVR